MASYDMESSPPPEAKEDEAKKISFRFCRECSNMLYPKEDRANSQLMFACRTCQFSEAANATCIWRNSLREDVQDTAGNTDDVAQDPTVGYPSSEMPVEDFDMGVEQIVPELCTLCGQEILCPICEGPSDGGVALEVEDPEVEVEEKGEEIVEAEKRERALSGAHWHAT